MPLTLKLCLKKATNKLLEVEAAKAFGKTCLDECFLFYVKTGRHFMKKAFYEKLRLLWDFFKDHVAVIFEATVLKKVRILYELSPQ